MRVLVVEDEHVIASALINGLRGEGYVVDHADRGDDAVWMATEQRYDAIVLDIMLPGMNGFVVCRTLRERGVDSPILMLTAKDGEFDEAEGLDTGADDYVTKPFSFVVLLARLRSLLRRGPAERPAVLEVGDLRLDPAERRVTRGGTPIELTPREFSLLRYLMHHAGRAVTKQEIVDGVWGDEFIDANVVQVYVGYLRRKVDEPFGRNTFQTVRGVGYRLVAERP
ncbi:MAG: response regulator transcription factor [Acidimicrobiia bacterium]|nr:response regulator transcription factor [Acidimicrobiia bacterium]